jgi:hypothetical protein
MIATYYIFNSLEVDKINFNEVGQTSVDTLRFSLNKSKTFVKYFGEKMPQCVADLTTKEGPYTVEEMRYIITGPEWQGPVQPPPKDKS